MSDDVCNYAVALLLTLAIETAVAWLLGYRRRLELACVAMVNVFSHPLLMFLLWILVQWRNRPVAIGWILLFEVAVVAVEWGLMCYALPDRSRRSLLGLSLTMNAASYLAGFLVPWNI